MSENNPNEPPFELLRYETQQDMVMRLDNSLIRYKNIPVWVTQSLEQPLHLNLLDIQTNEHIYNIHSSNPELDISAITLGFINFNNFSVYAKRFPFRNNKQGLNYENCRFLRMGVGSDVRISNILQKPHTAKCILNNYPTPDMCLSMLKSLDNQASSAFSKKFALVKDELGILKLKHMERSIGFMHKLDKWVTIPDELNNDYFQDQLEKLGLRVNG